MRIRGVDFPDSLLRSQKDGRLVIFAGADGWPTQAVFWLEWGSSTAGHNLPAARSRFLAVHSHSISTLPSRPVAYRRKLLHSQSSARSHNPRFTGLRWI